MNAKDILVSSKNLDNVYDKDDSKDYKKNKGPNCAGFVVLAQDHVLLVSSHKGNWGFPKGKKKNKEQLIDCAYRELREETGLKQEQIMPIDVDNTFFGEISNKGDISVKLYLATLTTDNLVCPKIEDINELEKAEWVKICDAEKLLILKNRNQILKSAVEKYDTFKAIKN